MTNREFLTAIASGTINEDVQAHAVASLEKLDAANLARKNKPSKKALENAPIIEQIVNEVLTVDTPMTAGQVAEAVGISTQKASALLRSIVAAGTAVATDVKVAGKGTVKAYSLAD